MNVRTKNEIFLKTFFELELYWLSSRTYQMSEWLNTPGDWCSECLMLYSEAWSAISESRKEFSLSTSEFDMFDKLYEMVKSFERYIPEFPVRLSQYHSLLNDPEWRKLQKYAKEIHDRIYPRL